ncbi:uncharacterized protein LOC134279701 [Saccostrea cucullata]|uniref:uncharacterized protein LOC134279701 n=1 Tax=Saccostrea cuccullata TaxID=36930 RepID=UPI002ED2D2A8
MPRNIRRKRSRLATEEPQVDQPMSESEPETDTVLASNMLRNLDRNNPLNWTIAELREKLNGLGIAAPKGLSATLLRQLYNENKRDHVIDRPREIDLGGNDVNENNNGGQQALFSSLQMMAKSCTALQNTVTSLLQKDKEKEEDNPLQKFTALQNTVTESPTTSGATGYSDSAFQTSCTSGDQTPTPCPDISQVMWSFNK